MSRRSRLLLLVAGIAFAVFVADRYTLCYRDDFTTHYPTLAFAARTLRGGELPLWNPLAPGGQPLGGDPNYLLFYPTTLLYLFLPAHTAFNLHFFLHLIVAWLAMRALAQRLGVSRPAAAWCATLYAASGAVVSCLAFYNLIVAAAVGPLALAALLALGDEPSWRRAWELGVCGGLLALSGEPVTLFGLAIVAMAVVPWRRMPLLLVATAVASVVASPLLIAFREIAPEVERFGTHFSAETTLAASVGPLELSGILTGPPRGAPADLRATGLTANLRTTEPPPFFPSVMIGALLFPALAAGWPRRPGLVVATVVLFLLALGRWNPLVRAVVDAAPALRIWRNPEKLLLAFTIAGCALIGVAFDEVRRLRAAAAIGIGAVVASGAAVLALVPLTTAARVQLAAMLLLQLATLAAFALGRRAAAAACALVALLYWVPLVAPMTSSFWLVSPSPVATALEGQRVYTGLLPRETGRESVRERAFRVAPYFGFAHNIAYAFAGSPDGMFSRRTALLQNRVSARTLRLYGVDAVLSDRKVVSDTVVARQAFELEGRPLFIGGVAAPRAAVTLARRVFDVPDEAAALRTIEAPEFDVANDAVCIACGIGSGGGTAAILRRTSQSLSIAVAAPRGALLVTDQSAFRAWHAADGAGHALRTIPVNVDRLGVVVPPGTTRVELVFSRLRGVIGAAWIAALLSIAAAVALRPFGRRLPEPRPGDVVD